jgi:predicted CXXCH cytochrome family protein
MTLSTPAGPLAKRVPIVALAALALGCGTARRAPVRSGDAVGRAPGGRVHSNIVRADYAGSARCAPCHADIYSAWARSPMHRMTRLPEGADVRAPFDGRDVRFKDDTASLTELGGSRFVRLASARFGDHIYRVTRVIGGRYREDFAGVEVPGPARSSPPPSSSPAGPELILPLSYVFETRSFRLKGYSVMVGERPGLRAGGVWTETCVFCHNTNPLFDSMWGALYGRGAPAYQGETVDHLLPPSRSWSLEVTDEAGLRAALTDEIAVLGGGPDGSAPPGEAGRRAALRVGMHDMRTRLEARHFVELGIGCESCHGGSREHADDPRFLPDFAPRSPFLRARPPDGWGEVTRAESINRTCARCHQVLFSRYPFTWEGGLRHGGGGSRGADAAPGGSSMTSGEARDFLLGGCARRMSCVTCHDPHAEDAPGELAKLAGAAGNAICTRCHGAYEAPAALRAHAHHDPAGAGGSCLACHMPRKNVGLGYALTRYHRIGSPTEPARVERDRPLECALCHPDRSVGALVGDMERWWGKRYDRAALADLYGDLDARPLEATLARGKAHEQATAVAALGEARAAGALPAVARQLVNPFPLVRYYARKAVGQIRGAPCDVDVERPVAEIQQAAKRCVGGEIAAPTAPAPVVPEGHDED